MYKKVLFNIFIFLLILCFTKNNSISQTWATDWANSGNGWIGGWHIANSDKYLTGCFTMGSSNDNKRFDLLCVNADNGWANLMSYYSSGWNADWSNGGSHYFQGYSGWYINSNDVYIPLYGASLGSTTHQLLAIHPSDWAMILKYNPSLGNWSEIYNNGGSGTIPNWILRADDKYVSGNFNSVDTRHELLCINPNGWATLFSFGPSSWTTYWTNGGNGSLPGWIIRSTDRYFSGDIDGDNVSELICVSLYNGWCTVFKYDGAQWNGIWSNGGNYWIGGWYMVSDSKFASYDFESNSKSLKEEFFAISNSARWCSIKRYEDAEFWPDLFTNYGSGWIGDWYMDVYDVYNFGNFYNGYREHCYILPINKNTGWAMLLRNSEGSSVADVNSNLIPNSFYISQNFPNPFNPETKISFGLPVREHVKIVLYNPLGSEVCEILNEDREAGNYVIDFRAANISSGVYFYKMFAGRYTETRKMIVIK